MRMTISEALDDGFILKLLELWASRGRVAIEILQVEDGGSAGADPTEGRAADRSVSGGTYAAVGARTSRRKTEGLSAGGKMAYREGPKTWAQFIARQSADTIAIVRTLERLGGSRSAMDLVAELDLAGKHFSLKKVSGTLGSTLRYARAYELDPPYRYGGKKTGIYHWQVPAVSELHSEVDR